MSIVGKGGVDLRIEELKSQNKQLLEELFSLRKACESKDEDLTELRQKVHKLTPKANFLSCSGVRIRKNYFKFAITVVTKSNRNIGDHKGLDLGCVRLTIFRNRIIWNRS